jgi:hypothetical protein
MTHLRLSSKKKSLQVLRLALNILNGVSRIFVVGQRNDVSFFSGRSYDCVRTLIDEVLIRWGSFPSIKVVFISNVFP